MKKPISQKLLIVWSLMTILVLTIILNRGIMEVCGLLAIVLPTLFGVRAYEKVKGVFDDPNQKPLI